MLSALNRKGEFMAASDPFGFDMSVSSSKKKNPRGRRSMSGASDTSTRLCEHDGCQEAGKFRAPKAPDVLDDFFWFCKDHVREYNLKWNFFNGTTEAEINAQRSKDKVWERETKDFRDTEARAWARLGMRIRIRFWAKMPQRTQANLEARLAVADVYRQPSAALWKS